MKNPFREPKSALGWVVSVLLTSIYGLAAGSALGAFPGALPANAQTVPTGVVADQNIPVVAASVSGPTATFLLNLDESVSYLSQGNITLDGCPALNQQPFVTGTGVEQNLIYDQTANLLYIMSELPDHNPGILAETPDPAGNCKPSPAVEIPGGLNYAQSMVSDAAKSKLYVVAAYQGVTPDQLFVLNTSSFSSYSSTNPPPSFLLDYGTNYGQVVVDPTSHLVYLPELVGGLGSAGPGFWVYDPSQNNVVHVLGYVDPTTNAPVDVSDLAIFVADNGKIVVVNSNPTPASTFPLNTLLEFDTTQFSFFTNTQAGSGFPTGVYVKPPAAAIVQYPRISQFNNISAASFDPVHGVVYVAAYLESSSSQIAPLGLLMGYNLATPSKPETLYSETVPQPVTSSGTTTTTYAGWGQLTYDTCANEALLFNSYIGTGSMAISAPLTGAGIAVNPIAFNPFNPVGLVVNQNSNYIYAPSVTAPISPSPGSPEVVFFAPPTTCAGSGGGGGGGGAPAPDALTLGNVPASTGSGVAISLNVVLQSSGTGTPTGNVTVAATGSGGTQAVTVPAALALAGGTTGTPASLVLSTPGLYNVTATYPGDANFAAATSPTYTIEVTQPAPASEGLAILIPGIIGSQNATTGTANSILSSTVFDGAGNFYVLDSGLGTVTEYPVGGSPLVIVPQAGNSFALTAPSDMILEADGASLLISDFGNNRLVRVALGSTVTITALPQSSVPAGPAACVNPVSGTNLCWPTGLAEDASGNIYVSDMGNGRVLKLDPFGNYLSTLLSAASSPLVTPLGLAVDAGGNLYVANSTTGTGTGSILKLPAQGTVQTFLSKNITQPYGLAVDPAGDLYFSDSGTKTVSVATGNGTVYPFAGNGATTDSGDGAPATGAGIAAPLGVTLDAAGNLYISDSVQQPPNGGVIRKVTASQSALAFGNVSLSTPSAPQQVTLLNAGRANLSLASAVVSGTNSSDFALTSSCGVLLAPAASCSLIIIFTPSTAAAESAFFTVTDNSGGAAAATQVVQLTGTGTTVPAVASPVFSPPAGSYPSAQSVSITSPTSGAAIHYTTDGSAATPASPLYSAPITVSTTETLSAIAVESGYNNSPVATAVYAIGEVPAAAPTFTPAAGTYTSAQSVTLASTTPGATIYYTTDGSTPTPASTAYTAAINVAQSETIQAIATAVGFQPSAVASAAYLINPSFGLLGKAGSTTDSTGAAATIGTANQAINATNGTPSLITLFFTPINGFNSAVTISSDFKGADSETWFCSNSTGTAAVSCTIPATNLNQPFYVGFLSGVPPARAAESPVNRHSHPRGLEHRPNQATAGSLGLAGSIGAMILFGVFWRRRGIFQAVIGICFIATIVSMSVMLAGCNPQSDQFTVTATPSTSSGVSAPGNGAPQTVKVWVTHDTSN